MLDRKNVVKVREDGYKVQHIREFFFQVWLIPFGSTMYSFPRALEPRRTVQERNKVRIPRQTQVESTRQTLEPR